MCSHIWNDSMKGVCHCSHVIYVLCFPFTLCLYVFNSTWLFYQLLFQNTWRFMIQCIVVEMQPRFLYFVWIDSLPNTFGWRDCLLYNTSLIFCRHSYGHCYCSVLYLLLYCIGVYIYPSEIPIYCWSSGFAMSSGTPLRWLKLCSIYLWLVCMLRYLVLPCKISFFLTIFY